jgi:NifB/MoaA-like Fe-S oxidoreductase
VPVGILTGELGRAVISPLVAELDQSDVRVIPVVNEFFGGNTGVTGLMVGADVARALAGEPGGHRYLLPDVCLSDDGRFLDGHTVADLPRPVEVVATDGHALRRALTPHRSGRSRSYSPTWAGVLPDAGNDAAQIETEARR